MKGGVGLLNLYTRSLSKALLDIFPNIGLDRSLFNFRPRISLTPSFYFILLIIPSSSLLFFFFTSENFWQEKGNMRKFFDSIARSKKFNPLTADNWYKLTSRNVLQVKVTLSLPFFLSLFLPHCSLSTFLLLFCFIFWFFINDMIEGRILCGGSIRRINC